jgi:hypothetical protein
VATKSLDFLGTKQINKLIYVIMNVGHITMGAQYLKGNSTRSAMKVQMWYRGQQRMLDYVYYRFFYWGQQGMLDYVYFGRIWRDSVQNGTRKTS